MKLRLACLSLLPLFVLLTGCFRSDVAVLSLRVPDLATERDLVLVTNAAQSELMGEIAPCKHWCEIDLAGGLVRYYEGPRLRDPAYIRRLVSSLATAGYAAQVRGVRFDPPPAIRVVNYPHPVVEWPERHMVELAISEIKTRRDGNRVVDALAYARLGGRPEQLRVDPARRTVTISGQNRRQSASANYRFRIASAGYAVDGWPADCGQPDPPARGWEPAD